MKIVNIPSVIVTASSCDCSGDGNVASQSWYGTATMYDDVGIDNRALKIEVRITVEFKLFRASLHSSKFIMGPSGTTGSLSSSSFLSAEEVVNERRFGDNDNVGKVVDNVVGVKKKVAINVALDDAVKDAVFLEVAVVAE